MDTQVKEVILSNKTVLLKNIIPCKELFDKLVDQGVIPDSTLREIQQCTKQEDKVWRMLDYVSFRGHHVAMKFCDALQLSGHNFVADFLRDEIAAANNQKSSQHVNVSEFYSKFPKLEQLIADKDKAEMAVYFSDKIKEQAVRQMWRGNAREKEKAMDAKQRQIEDVWKFKVLLKEKDDTIEELQNLINGLNQQSLEKGKNLHDLKRHMQEIKEKHQRSMETQMQYNVANDKSLQRMSERQAEMQAWMNSTAEALTDMLKQTSKSRKSETSSEVDYDALKMSQGDQIHQQLFEVKKELDDFMVTKQYVRELEDEKHYVLVQMGGVALAGSEKPSLIDSFRDYAAQKEEIYSGLQNKIESLQSEVLRLESNIPDVDVIEELESSIDELQKSLNTAQKRISLLEQENLRLRSQISIAKYTREKTRDGPRVKGEMSMVKDEPEMVVVSTAKKLQPEPNRAPSVHSDATADVAMVTGKPQKESSPSGKDTPAWAKQYLNKGPSPHPYTMAPNLVHQVRAPPSLAIKVEKKLLYQGRPSVSKDADDKLILPPLTPSNTSQSPPKSEPQNGLYVRKPMESFTLTPSPRKQRPPLLRQESKSRLDSTQTLNSGKQAVGPIRRYGTFYK